MENKGQATAAPSKKRQLSSSSEVWAGIKVSDIISETDRTHIIQLMVEIAEAFNVVLKPAMDFQKVCKKSNKEGYSTLFFPIQRIEKSLLKKRLHQFKTTLLQNGDLQIVFLDHKELDGEAKGLRAWEARESLLFLTPTSNRREKTDSSVNSLSSTLTGSSYSKVVQAGKSTLTSSKRKASSPAPSLPSGDPLSTPPAITPTPTGKRLRTGDRTISGILIDGLSLEISHEEILSVIADVTNRLVVAKRTRTQEWSYHQSPRRHSSSGTSITIAIAGVAESTLEGAKVIQVKKGIQTRDANGLVQIKLLDDTQIVRSTGFTTWSNHLISIHNTVANDSIVTTSEKTDTTTEANVVVNHITEVKEGSSQVTSLNATEITTVMNVSVTTETVNDASKMDTTKSTSTLISPLCQDTALNASNVSTNNEAFNPTTGMQTSSRSSTSGPSNQSTGDRGIGTITNSLEITPVSLFENVNLACTAMLQPVLNVLHYEIIDREKASVQRLHDHQSVLSIERRLLQIESDKILVQAINSRQLESRSKFHMRRLRATINVGFNAGRNHKWLKSFLKFHVPTMRLLSDYSVTKPGLPETILTMYKKCFREFDLNLSSIIGDTKTTLPAHPRKLKLRKAVMASRYINTHGNDSDDNYEDIDSDTDLPTLADAANQHSEVIDLQHLSEDDEATVDDDGGHSSASRSHSLLVTDAVGSDGKDGVHTELEQVEVQSEAAIASNIHLVSGEDSESEKYTQIKKMVTTVEDRSDKKDGEEAEQDQEDPESDQSSHNTASLEVRVTTRSKIGKTVIPKPFNYLISTKNVNGCATFSSGKLEAHRVEFATGGPLTKAQCDIILGTIKLVDTELRDDSSEMSLIIFSQDDNYLQEFTDTLSQPEPDVPLQPLIHPTVANSQPTIPLSQTPDTIQKLRDLGASEETVSLIRTLVYTEVVPPEQSTTTTSEISTVTRSMCSGVKKWGLTVIESQGYIQDTVDGVWYQGLGKGLCNGGNLAIPADTNFITFKGGVYIDRVKYDKLPLNKKGYAMEPPGRKKSSSLLDLYEARQRGEEASAANSPSGVFDITTNQMVKANAYLSYSPTKGYSLISNRKIYPGEEIWYCYGVSFNIIHHQKGRMAEELYSSRMLSCLTDNHTSLWQRLELLQSKANGFQLQLSGGIDASSLLVTQELVGLTLNSSTLYKITNLLQLHGSFQLTRISSMFEEEWNSGQGFCGASVMYSAHRRHHKGIKEIKASSTSALKQKNSQRAAVIEFLKERLEDAENGFIQIDQQIVTFFNNMIAADYNVEGSGLAPEEYLQDWMLTAFDPEVPKHLWVAHSVPGYEYLSNTSFCPDSFLHYSTETLQKYFDEGFDIRHRFNHYVLSKRCSHKDTLDRLLETLSVGILMLLGGDRPP